MFLAADFFPLCRINFRKKNIAFERTVHTGEVNLIRACHRLCIDFPTADDDNFVGVSSSGKLKRSIK